jgi:hypothetical protein
MCRLHCEHISSELQKGIKGAQFAELLSTLTGRINDEMELVVGWTLTASEAALYEQKEPLFGQAVFDRFESARVDIEEAGRCLAFNRGTATVMHLMRVMEVGLKAIARPLGIPYAPSWEGYLRQISDRMSSPTKKKPRQWRKIEPFFRDVSGDLLTIKHAWRNPSMHVVRRYSPEEADEILRAVRRFMQRLAEGLPTSKPKTTKKDAPP